MTAPLPATEAGQQSAKVIVITGANTGLGLEAARRLLDAGHIVCMTARDPARGRSAADPIGGVFVQLDVTDEDSVRGAAEEVGARFDRVDVLVNNAAVPAEQVSAETVTAEDFRRVFDTNVFGVVRVIHAFLPLLRRSDSPSIVNIGSESGSFGTVTDPLDPRFGANGLVYGSSKAALSMMTLQYSKLLDDVQVNAIAPGFTKTRFNGNSGTQTLTEGTEALVQLIADGRSAGTGRFLDRHGPIAW